MDEGEDRRRLLRVPSDAWPARGCGITGIVATPAPINRNSRLSVATPNLPFARELTEITINRGGDKAEGRGRFVLICPRRQINFAGAPRIRFVRIVHSVIGAVAAPCHARLVSALPARRTHAIRTPLCVGAA